MPSQSIITALLKLSFSFFIHAAICAAAIASPNDTTSNSVLNPPDTRGQSHVANKGKAGNGTTLNPPKSRTTSAAPAKAAQVRDAGLPLKSKTKVPQTKSASADEEAAIRERIKRLDALKPKFKIEPLPPMGLPDESQLRPRPNPSDSDIEK